jgi:hypothetical protein
MRSVFTLHEILFWRSSRSGVARGSLCFPPTFVECQLQYPSLQRADLVQHSAGRERAHN